jgi:spermidine/putrescine transport system permease protein
MQTSSRLVKWLISAPPLAFMLIFFAAPSLIMIFTSFRLPGEFGGLAPVHILPGDTGEDSGLTIETYRFFFSDFIYFEIFLKSFAVAALTTVICIAMAYPLALLIARSGKKFRNLMIMLVVLPFASNFLIRIYAWMIILGPESALSHMINSVLAVFGMAPVTLLFSPFAVLIGMIYVHSAVHDSAAVYQSGKTRPYSAGCRAGSGRERLATLLVRNLAAIPARHSFRIGAGFYSCPRHVCHSRYFRGDR